VDQTLLTSTLWIKHCLPPHHGSNTVCIHTVDQTLFASTPWIKNCLHSHCGPNTVCLHTVDQTLFASTPWIKNCLHPHRGPNTVCLHTVDQTRFASRYRARLEIYGNMDDFPLPTYSYTYVLLYLRTPPMPTYSSCTYSSYADILLLYLNTSPIPTYSSYTYVLLLYLRTSKDACFRAIELLEQTLLASKGNSSSAANRPASTASTNVRLAVVRATNMAEDAQFSYAINAARRSEKRRVHNFVRLLDYMICNALHVLLVGVFTRPFLLCQ